MINRELIEVDLVQDNHNVRIKGTHEYVRLDLASVAVGREVQVTFQASGDEDQLSYLLKRTGWQHSMSGYPNNDWHLEQLSFDQKGEHYNNSGLWIADSALSADPCLDFLTPTNTMLEHGSQLYANQVASELPSYMGKVAAIEMLPFIPPTQTASLQRPSVTPWRGAFAQMAA